MRKKNTLYWYVNKILVSMGIDYGNCFSPTYKEYFKMDAIYGDVTEYDKFNDEEYFEDY